MYQCVSSRATLWPLRISNFENGILGFSSCRVKVNSVWKTFVRESVREFVHKVSTRKHQFLRTAFWKMSHFWYKFRVEFLQESSILVTAQLCVATWVVAAKVVYMVLPCKSVTLAVANHVVACSRAATKTSIVLACATHCKMSSRYYGRIHANSRWFMDLSSC